MDNLIFGLKTSQIDIDADVNRLARRLSETHIPPPIEANDQELRKYHRSPSHGEGKKAWIHFPPGTTLDEQLLILGGGEALLQRMSELKIDFASTQSVQDAMSAHLVRLQITPTRAVSFTQNAAMYIAGYSSLIKHDWSADAVSHAELPQIPQVLEELSRYMADEVYRRYRLGFSPTLSPLRHPYHPFWLPEHEGNYAIEALARKEEQEATDKS